MVNVYNNFCVVPFVGLATTTQGKIRPCCQAGTLGDLHTTTHTIEEIWNSTEYKNLRNDFVNNKWPDVCSVCQKNEEKNILSRRIFENLRWKSLTNLELPNEALESPWAIDLRLGNLCNLKCVMCGPHNSNTWTADYKNFDHLSHFDDNINFKWPQKKSFIDDIDTLVKNVKLFHFSGGEPLLLKKHKEVINHMIDNNLASEKILFYDTNGTYIDQFWIDKWKRFKQVTINFSIDGAKEVNEYIRYPINHDDIIRKFELLSNCSPNINVKLQVSVGALNIFEIPKLRKYTTEYNFEPILNISIVDWPNFLSLNALSESSIKQAKLQFQNDYSVRLKGLIKNLNHNPENFEKLKLYLLKLDKVRNTDATSIFNYIYQ